MDTYYGCSLGIQALILLLLCQNIVADSSFHSGTNEGLSNGTLSTTAREMGWNALERVEDPFSVRPFSSLANPVPHSRSKRQLFQRLWNYLRTELLSSKARNPPEDSVIGRSSRVNKSVYKGSLFKNSIPGFESLIGTISTSKQRIEGIKVMQTLNSLSEDKVCGRQLLKKTGFQSRITGGSKAYFGEWPWQLSLRLKVGKKYQHQCGATLLNKYWGITAAHCVSGIPKRLFLVRVGEFDTSTDIEPLRHTDVAIDRIVMHPFYETLTLQNDLALIRFQTPVTYQENSVPICIPEENELFVDETAYATGWGRIYENGPVSSVLLKMKVPILSNRQCGVMFGKSFFRVIPDVFLCAGRSEGGLDACEGDSGGPLVVQRNSGRWVLVGITSSGRGPGCGRPNKPGFYTRVSKYSEWILDHIAEDDT